MSAATIMALLLIGLAAGFMSSMIGIGGGIVIVPALVILLGMDQLRAQGTSLATFLPPIGILAVLQYHREGKIDWKVAGILCITFVLGSFLGANVVLNLDKQLVKRLFAFFLILVACKMLFLDKPPAGPAPPPPNTQQNNSQIP